MQTYYTMTKRERIRAAISSQTVDRVPISFWGHFASDPHRAEELASATIAFQEAFDWDFVKLMPSGMYLPEAYGCALTPASGPGAVNGLAESIVKRPQDWASLPVLDPNQGWLAEHLRSIRLVRDALGPDVPIVETLFSPLTIAHKLSLHLPFSESVDSHRELLLAGLASVAETSRRFATACLDAGADGFFFATQESNAGTLGREDFIALGRRFDLEVLGALDARAWLNLLHVCRTEIYADLVADYPVQAINWDSERTAPTLEGARRVWKDVCLVGGLDREGEVLVGKPTEVATAVRSAAARAGREGFVVGAGCGLLTGRHDANLRAAREAVEGL
jgi:uroporphyrinogen decarboxylase